MREGSPTLVRREDYLAPAYWIRTVDLTFDLDPAKTIVSSRLALERNTTRPAEPIRLDGEDLNLLRVLVDGQSVSFRHEDGQLVIDAPGPTRSPSRSATRSRPRRTPSSPACTPRVAASSRSARRRASAASPTSSTGRT